MKALGIIPARYQSTRFPGKPLALLGNAPMLRHVFENVNDTGLFSKVIIATDDIRIKEAAESWHATVVMTSDQHPSGTDRCAEIISKSEEHYDVVVNIQGDEPFISKTPIEQILNIFQIHPEAGIGTLVHKINDPDDIWDENTAKVVLSKSIDHLPFNGSPLTTNNQQPTTIRRALYFSRSPIPFVRSIDKANWLQKQTFWKHIGIYAYRPDVLKEIVKLPVGNLEKAESLEQLRWIEYGFAVYVAETEYKMFSVDTENDLKKAEKFLKIRVG